MQISGMGGVGHPGVTSGASARQAPHQKMTNLYKKIDTSGSGAISKDQFQQAFDALNPPKVFKDQGAANIFSALDPNGTGSVSQNDFVNGMKGLMVSLRSSANPLGS